MTLAAFFFRRPFDKCSWGGQGQGEGSGCNKESGELHVVSEAVILVKISSRLSLSRIESSCCAEMV